MLALVTFSRHPLTVMDFVPLMVAAIRGLGSTAGSALSTDAAFIEGAEGAAIDGDVAAIFEAGLSASCLDFSAPSGAVFRLPAGWVDSLRASPTIVASARLMTVTLRASFEAPPSASPREIAHGILTRVKFSSKANAALFVRWLAAACCEGDGDNDLDTAETSETADGFHTPSGASPQPMAAATSAGAAAPITPPGHGVDDSIAAAAASPSAALGLYTPVVPSPSVDRVLDAPALASPQDRRASLPPLRTEALPAPASTTSSNPTGLQHTGEPGLARDSAGHATTTHRPPLAEVPDPETHKGGASLTTADPPAPGAIARMHALMSATTDDPGDDWVVPTPTGAVFPAISMFLSAGSTADLRGALVSSQLAHVRVDVLEPLMECLARARDVYMLSATDTSAANRCIALMPDNTRWIPTAYVIQLWFEFLARTTRPNNLGSRSVPVALPNAAARLKALDAACVVWEEAAARVKELASDIDDALRIDATRITLRPKLIYKLLIQPMALLLQARVRSSAPKLAARMDLAFAQAAEVALDLLSSKWPDIAEDLIAARREQNKMDAKAEYYRITTAAAAADDVVASNRRSKNKPAKAAVASTAASPKPGLTTMKAATGAGAPARLATTSPMKGDGGAGDGDDASHGLSALLERHGSSIRQLAKACEGSQGWPSPSYTPAISNAIAAHDPSLLLDKAHRDSPLAVDAALVILSRRAQEVVSDWKGIPPNLIWSRLCQVALRH